MTSIREGFSKALLAGYGGKTIFEKVERGPFAMLSSTLNEGSLAYVDQWFAGQLGGGQEILEIAGKRYTRLYGGGTLDNEALGTLGIDHGKVIEALKYFLN